MSVLRSESEAAKTKTKTGRQTPEGQGQSGQIRAEEQTRNVGMYNSPCDRVAVGRL
jgi:hypothetical protein